MSENTLNHCATACRWAARIIGGLLALTTLLIAVGEGVPNPFMQPLKVQIGFFALALVLAGILAGWRWELPGGIVSLSGWVLFSLAVIPFSKAPNGFVLSLALPGVLYLAASLLRRRALPSHP